MGGMFVPAALRAGGQLLTCQLTCGQLAESSVQPCACSSTPAPAEGTVLFLSSLPAQFIPQSIRPPASRQWVIATASAAPTLPPAPLPPLLIHLPHNASQMFHSRPPPAVPSYQAQSLRRILAKEEEETESGSWLVREKAGLAGMCVGDTYLFVLSKFAPCTREYSGGQKLCLFIPAFHMTVLSYGECDQRMGQELSLLHAMYCSEDLRHCYFALCDSNRHFLQEKNMYRKLSKVNITV